MCLDEQRLNGCVRGIEEVGQAKEVGDVQVREEGAEIGEMVGKDGGLHDECACGGGGTSAYGIGSDLLKQDIQYYIGERAMGSCPLIPPSKHL